LANTGSVELSTGCRTLVLQQRDADLDDQLVGSQILGHVAVSSPASRKAVLPGFTTISSPVAGSLPIGNVFISAASISSRFFCTIASAPAGRRHLPK